MTQEQLNHIQSVLINIKTNSMLVGKTDGQLARIEGSRQWSYDRIKKIYEEDYMTLGSINACAEKQGVDKSTLLLWFNRYGFKTDRCMRGSKKVLTQKHLDTLTMRPKDWNVKYSAKSEGLFYNYKNVARKFAQQKNS
jgi:hypothetical protein